MNHVTWPEISIEDFPPRRDDEPSSLRQDIIDELSDHFACALNRELLKNNDEQTAKQRVLNQFGDPIKLARKLWLDEMKERIMSQRILTGVSVAMAICGFIVVGLIWTMMRQNQSLNLQMLAQMKELADRPAPVAVNQQDPQLLERLEALMQKQKAESDSSSGAMNLVLLHLVAENKEGKPAVGFSGTLTKVSTNGGDFKINAVSDAQGELDFGKLPWGKYQLHLKSPWGEEWNGHQFSTLPGRKFEATIVCPATVPAKVPVEFQVDWPTRPEDKSYYLLCDFRLQKSYSNSAFLMDAFRDSFSDLNGEYFLQTTQTFQQNPSWELSWWTYRCSINQEPENLNGVFLVDVLNNRIAPCPVTPEGAWENIVLEELNWQSNVEFLQGGSYLPAIYLLRKNDLARLEELNSLEQVMAIVRSDNGIGLENYERSKVGLIISPFQPFKLSSQVMGQLAQFQPLGGKRLNVDKVTVNGYRENRINSGTNYIAKKDQPNVWKLKIPALFPITRESGSLSSDR